MSAITVCASGRMPPPPNPWSARARMSVPHRGRQRAGERARQEDRDRDQHHRAPPVDVGKLAEQRGRDRGGEQIGRHHPGQTPDVAETLADRGQRRRHDGLLQRRQEHRQHQSRDDRARRGMLDPGRRRTRPTSTKPGMPDWCNAAVSSSFGTGHRCLSARTHTGHARRTIRRTFQAGDRATCGAGRPLPALVGPAGWRWMARQNAPAVQATQ